MFFKLVVYMSIIIDVPIQLKKHIRRSTFTQGRGPHYETGIGWVSRFMFLKFNSVMIP